MYSFLLRILFFRSRLNILSFFADFKAEDIVVKILT